MASFGVNTVSRTTLRESVAAQLRTAVTSGVIPVGTHLAEVELSESIGVSRATLREALRQLQQEGLLTQDNRGRVSVRQVTRQEIRDLFEVRLGLETIAVERLCRRADRTPAISELRARLELLKSDLTLADALQADLGFHEELCRLSGNPTLHQSWVNISGLIRITMVASGADPARANMAFERHAPIVDLIEAGDVAAAHRFIQEHMDSAADVLLNRMVAA